LKIMIAGDWHSEVHEEPVFRAFEQLGHWPIRFPWHSYFVPSGPLSLPFCKLQNKYMIGPLIGRMNRDLVQCASSERPDALFVYRGTHILLDTLRSIRRSSPATVLVGYNNDDPFSDLYPKWQWRHFLRAVPEYDLMLAYRSHNLAEFKVAGARRVELLRSWFVPERNRPVELSADDQARYACDVVFVGHYEDDGRVEYLREVVRLGLKLRLWGPGYDWDRVLRHVPELKHLVPVQLAWGDEYNKALCGAKVALCFMSKLNRDTYTRRSFEIPASRVLMLSYFTEDLAGLFIPGVEADYFSSVGEMKQKLVQYIRDPAARSRVAQAGYNKVFQSGHDVVSRMRSVMTWLSELQSEGNRCAA
jgi:hypothetical protein